MDKRLYLLLVLFALAITPRSAYAQSVGLEVQPELTTLYAKPGSTVTIPVVIKNTGTQGSFSIENTMLVPQIANGDLVPSKTHVNGISIRPRTVEPFFLPTGAKKTLEMTIAIDPHITEHDYYFGMKITSEGKKRSEGKSSLAVKLNVLSTVLLTVTNDGNMNISGYINSFIAGNKSNVRFFDSTQDIPLYVSMHNSGDNWMYTSGIITISNMLGKKQRIQIPQQRVLAGSKRLMRSSQVGIVDSTAVLTGVHVGRYTATTYMTIEGKNTMATKTITFIALPFRLIGALALLGVLAVVLGVRVNRPAQPRVIHAHQL